MEPRKICIITGSRADYGLYYWIMRDIQSDKDLELQIAVTGMHLDPTHGETWKILADDGFSIDARIETQLSSDTAVGVSKSLGLGIIGFADTFVRLRPDIVLVLGDRYEMFAAAQAAYFAKIPVAHIAGGDVTEGAFDEAIRHSITKMAYLHFATNTDSARRIRQLGEADNNILNVGSPGIDTLLRTKLLSRTELETQLSISLTEKNYLVTFHPTTLDIQSPEEQVHELCTALKLHLDEETSIIVTRPNADAGGRAITTQLEKFAEEEQQVYLFESLGQLRYLSLMAICDAVIGNSSSGLYEAPSFKKPVVNIGNRQKGRIAASSVIHTNCHHQAIHIAIEKASRIDCSSVSNPYGDGQASNRIVQSLKEKDISMNILQKQFHDL